MIRCLHSTGSCGGKHSFIARFCLYPVEPLVVHPVFPPFPFYHSDLYPTFCAAKNSRHYHTIDPACNTIHERDTYRCSMTSHLSDVDGSSSWLKSISQCCAPLTSCFGRRRSDETSTRAMFEKQPGQTPRSGMTGPRPVSPTAANEKLRKGFGHKKRHRSDGSGRLLISGPSDFRHIQSGSFQVPSTCTAAQLRPNPPLRRSFRPLELSIYRPDNSMSPILPHFEFPSIAAPEPAQLHERLDDEYELVRQGSNSSTPFHLPRKQVGGKSPSIASEQGVPAIPSRSKERARAHTSPEIEIIKARVAGALNEMEALQKQIDDVIERQSLHMSSRPSTAHSMSCTVDDVEPIPAIPALPPLAPSFAARLHDIDRPSTAPLRTESQIINRSQEFGDMTAASTPTRPQPDDHPLPPPLPLVLRPPLRKKKSFSRVSTWLFPSGHHKRDVSLDSITNQPRPIKGTEGFYQCVAPGGGDGGGGRQSFDSVGTVMTWDSDEEQRTVPTTWSPGSTPVTKIDGGPLERSTTFGKNGSVARV